MQGDKIGLQVQSGREEINKILIALELNNEVIKEAKESGADCIITFHPLIYNPITQILESDRVGNICSELIRNSICMVSIHTNFDAFSKGTSEILANKLGLDIKGFLEPDENYLNAGMGVIAESEKELSANELLDKVLNVCNSPIRFSPPGNSIKINRIAIVGGSGMSFIERVKNSGVQAFITADITYHRFHDVNGRIMLIDPGHYEMEQFVPDGIGGLLSEKTDDLLIEVSGVLTNPIRYYPDTEKYLSLQKKYLLQNNRMV